jgi:hypothetical protein
LSGLEDGSMADLPLRSLQLLDDAGLAAALGDLAEAIDWPTAGPASPGGADIATAVRVRIEAGTTRPTGAPGAVGVGSGWGSWRPVRRVLVVATVAVLALAVLAALAGAAGLGLPGSASCSDPRRSAATLPGRRPERIAGRRARCRDAISVNAWSSPTSTSGLGSRCAGHRTRRSVRPMPPTSTRRSAARSRSCGGTRPGLPDTIQPGVGLVMSAFRGSYDSSFLNKAVGSGTIIQLVQVDGERAFWLSGGPHFFFYSSPSGQVFDPRRWVGDALLWSDGSTTYRLESALGRERTIEVAESLP